MTRKFCQTSKCLKMLWPGLWVAHCFHPFGNHLTEWHRLINFDNLFLLPITNVKRRSNQNLFGNQITVVPGLNIPGSFQACNPLNSNRMCAFQPDRKQSVIISLDFILEFIPYAYNEAFSQTSHKQEQCDVTFVSHILMHFEEVVHLVKWDFMLKSFCEWK